MVKNAAAKDKDTNAVFVHCFLTMIWNLMCRSRNTVNIMMEHISFNGDSMTVQFAYTKTDMSGAQFWHKWHCFANSGRPEICPILSLARYRTTFPHIQKGALFPGGAQYSQFRSLLNNHILPANAAAIRRLGIEPKDIGVHSIHKGANSDYLLQ